MDGWVDGRDKQGLGSCSVIGKVSTVGGRECKVMVKRQAKRLTVNSRIGL